MKKVEANVPEKVKSMLVELEKFITTKSVIGEPIISNDITIIPIVDINFGLGVTANDAKDNGFAFGGMGATMTPNALLIIQGEETRLMSLKSPKNAIEVLPQILKEIENIINKSKQ